MTSHDGMDAAVVIALGSNLGGDYSSPATLLEAAVAALGSPDLRLLARSSWWGSAAWPDVSQPEFLNGVILVETNLDPKSMLLRLHSIEQSFGRSPGPRNAPRTLDLDLIAYG